MSLSISRAWDETTAVFKRDGKPLWTIALALIGLPFTLTTLIAPAPTPGNSGNGSVLLSLVVALLLLVATLAISMIALRQDSTAGRAIGDATRKLLSLILAMLIIGIPLVILLVVLGGVIVGGDVSPQVLETELAAGRVPPPVVKFMLWAALVVLLVNAKMVFMTPVAAMESDSPFRIVKRAWELSRGHYLKLLGFLLLYLLVCLLLFLTMQFVVGTTVIALFGMPEPLSIGALIIGLAGGAVYTVVIAVYAVMAARMYMQVVGADAAVPVIPRD